MPNSIMSAGSLKIDLAEYFIDGTLWGQCALIESEVVHCLLGLKDRFCFIPNLLKAQQLLPGNPFAKACNSDVWLKGALFHRVTQGMKKLLILLDDFKKFRGGNNADPEYARLVKGGKKSSSLQPERKPLDWGEGLFQFSLHRWKVIFLELPHEFQGDV